ncbi:MAG: zinc ABC transporter substrate-binding protein [Euryarchaeota archaeon]|jgi:zinc transport system substrate-binding protein|nr:zinc ABC transporter substrate-binding protein [Euryarchaeota archaeon]
MTSKRKQKTLSRRNVLAAGAGVAGMGLAGCFGDDPQNGEDNGAGGENGENGEGDADFTVFATMPAIWDFVRQVAGDQIDVIDLVPVGEHGHDWNPEPGTVQELDGADGFVYLREFSSWQDDAAAELEDDDVVVIEASEGIEFFDSPAEDNDEHWWMDPVECQNGVENIAAGIAEIDPDNEDTYMENAEAFNEELEELHEDFEAIVEESELNELVVGTHDSFQWWNRRYGLEIFSPVGTSPDDAASPEDVQEIETLIEEVGIGHVLFDVGEPGQLAESLAEETDAEILPLSPVETQIDGSPPLDTDVEMEPDWGYIDHFREINLPSIETALQAE